MTINGSYVLEKNENLVEFLKNLGLAEDRVQQMNAVKPHMTLNLTGTHLEITTKVDDKTVKNALTLGSPSSYTFSSGFDIEVTLNISGNSGKGVLKKADRTGEFNIEFGDSTVTEIFKVGGQTCKRIYKKV